MIARSRCAASASPSEIAGLVALPRLAVRRLHHRCDLHMSTAAAAPACYERPRPQTIPRVPWYWRALDFEQLARDYPPPPTSSARRSASRATNCAHCRRNGFLATIARGWEIPFFQRHWGKAGMEPGDIRGARRPAEDPAVRRSHDSRDSIERAPPFGDFMGISPADGARCRWCCRRAAARPACRGRCSMRRSDRETMAILGGRRFAMQGVRPGDMVLVRYSLGLVERRHGRRAKRSGTTRARCR